MESNLSSNSEVFSDNTYTIRPPLHEKVNPGVVEELLKGVLSESLDGKAYRSSSDNISGEIDKIILKKLGDLSLKNYKFVLATVISENKGQGIVCNSEAIWDPDTDVAASYTYINDSIICMVTVYSIYHY